MVKPATCSASPLTSHLSLLTSHCSPLTAHLSPLTSRCSKRIFSLNFEERSDDPVVYDAMEYF